MLGNAKKISVESDYSLDVSSAEMRQWMQQTLDHLIPYLESQSELPMKDVEGLAAIRENLREPLPQKGESLDTLLELIFKDLLPKGIQVHNPGYLAYIPIGSLYHATLAEFITFAVNRWAGLYQYAPGFLEIENVVIHWLCDIMGLPAGSGGILTSGGSLANFSAIVTARSTHLGEDFSKGVMYFSKYTHHSIEKSARLAGFPKKHLRSIETDDKFRMSVDALALSIRKDKEQGLKPFLVVANAGTTGTGAVDDLVAIAELCRKEKLWLHIDAAWAGAFRLTAKGKEILAGTELGDSITIDPHKALYTPFGCGALLVRNPKYLRDAHSFEAGYLPGENEEETLLSPAKLSPELSRNVRGLQVWLPLKMLGIQPFISTLEEKLELANWLSGELKKIENVHIVFEPQTAIVGFRFVLPDKSKDVLNTMNNDMLERINAHKRILLSSMEIDGYFVIRIIPFGQKTHFAEVSLAIEYIKEAAIFSQTGYK